MQSWFFIHLSEHKCLNIKWLLSPLPRILTALDLMKIPSRGLLSAPNGGLIRSRSITICETPRGLLGQAPKVCKVPACGTVALPAQSEWTLISSNWSHIVHGLFTMFIIKCIYFIYNIFHISRTVVKIVKFVL